MVPCAERRRVTTQQEQSAPCERQTSHWKYTIQILMFLRSLVDFPLWNCIDSKGKDKTKFQNLRSFGPVSERSNHTGPAKAAAKWPQTSGIALPGYHAPSPLTRKHTLVGPRVEQNAFTPTYFHQEILPLTAAASKESISSRFEPLLPANNMPGNF